MSKHEQKFGISDRQKNLSLGPLLLLGGGAVKLRKCYHWASVFFSIKLTRRLSKFLPYLKFSKSSF